jgi:WD40 repeat protein
LSLWVLSNGFLASGSRDATIKIWNINKEILLRTIKGHSYGINTLAVLKDGSLINWSRDTRIIRWDVDKEVAICSITIHSDRITSLVVLSDGSLASSNYSKTIRIIQSLA